MMKQKSVLSVFVVTLFLVIGAIVLFSNGDSEVDTVTPTPVPTMNLTVTPEPSVTTDPSAIVTGEVSGEEIITPDEIATHATADDCWMAIEGNVYDVTDFVNQHPGGEAIVMGCGTDATALFTDRPNDQGEHSATARALLPQYLIGQFSE